jgi:diguanylate cyclase (GGDEF)-like protein
VVAPDADLEQAIGILFDRRRADYDAARVRPAADAAEALTGALARGAVVAARAEALESHGQEVLQGVLTLLRVLRARPEPAWALVRYAAYVDGLVALECQRLDGGAAAAERNRLVNAAAALKVRARERFSLELAVDDRDAPASAASAPLDDRLPLRRRGAFDQDLTDQVERARRRGQPLALVMIDIDHFKRVNDQHGHPVGDEVLLAVAQRVVQRVGDKGTAYRYGGEEFALLLPGYSAEEAAGLAERIRKDIRESAVSSRRLDVTASLGVAAVHARGHEPRALLERADAALYEAKHGGRDQVRTAAD